MDSTLPTEVRPDHYGELCVEPSASAEEISRSYKRLVKLAHPDLGGSRGAFERLNYAYAVLRNPLKRLQYDKLIAAVKDARQSSIDGSEINTSKPMESYEREIVQIELATNAETGTIG